MSNILSRRGAGDHFQNLKNQISRTKKFQNQILNQKKKKLKAKKTDNK